MQTAEVKKKRTVRINGCVAAAQAAKYADVDVIAAYPIRPYTATMMALAQMVANGELDGVRVSECAARVRSSGFGVTVSYGPIGSGAVERDSL